MIRFPEALSILLLITTAVNAFSFGRKVHPDNDNGVYCSNTGFFDVQACTLHKQIAQILPPASEPQQEKMVLQELASMAQEAKNLQYYRRVDVGLYQMTGNKAWLGHILRIRHAMIYVRIGKTEKSLHIHAFKHSKGNDTKFFIAVDSLGKTGPRSLEDAKQKNIKGFKRQFQCYSSTSSQNLAAAIIKFSQSGLEYDSFLYNCRHFVLYILRTMCGREVSLKVKKDLFHVVMAMFGERRSFRRRSKRKDPNASIPIYEQTPEGLKLINSKDELSRVLMK